MVELILALVLLAVGLLGSAGLMIHSQQLMRRAESREWAARVARSLVDSLATVGGEGSGERAAPEGRVTWSSQAADGVLRIRIEIDSRIDPGANSVIFETVRLLPVGADSP